MKTYKWLRGLLKASAFTTVMFVMQACYGTPQQYKEPDYDEGEETTQVVDTLEVNQEVVLEAEAE
ncbi:MAG: hypothetical protein II887_02305 [Bacteroidales bacterium]|nr:hypothetical protein [Bacteroidales bacterium]